MTKKRGRPATGKSTAQTTLHREISAQYTVLRLDGVSHEAALAELASRQWYRRESSVPITLGEEAIKAAIKDARSFGINEDDFRSSVRLQKVHPLWKEIFEFDPLSGDVRPKR